MASKKPKPQTGGAKPGTSDAGKPTEPPAETDDQSFIQTSKRSIRHSVPEWAHDWVLFVKGKPTVQKLVVVFLFLFVVSAWLMHVFHARAARRMEAELEKRISQRDQTIGAQQNTLSTNGYTIEALRSELQVVSRENTSLQRRYEDIRQDRDAARSQLAPFLAAGKVFFQRSNC